MQEPNAVEQSIRRSHCSNTGKEHACVGTMKVSPAGIELSCELCGSTGMDPHFPYEVIRATERLAEILGIDIDKLAPETRTRAYQFIAAMDGGVGHDGRWQDRYGKPVQ